MRRALLAVLLLSGCATTHGGGGGNIAAGGALCRTFYASDFRASRVHVSAGGNLLTYSQPSTSCGGARP